MLDSTVLFLNMRYLYYVNRAYALNVYESTKYYSNNAKHLIFKRNVIIL